MVTKLGSKIILLVCAICVLSFAGYTADDFIQSTPVSSPIRVDGMMDDWADVELQQEKKFGIDYAFKNDGDLLFILFVFNDPRYLTSINQTGMTIYLNSEGKKNKDYYINFRMVKVSAEDYIDILESRGRILTDADKERIKANPSYTLNENEVTNEKAKDLTLPEGIQLKSTGFNLMNQPNNVLVYEFVIPLERVAQMAPGVGVKPGETFKIGFEWGGMTKAMRDQRMKGIGDQAVRAQDVKAGGLTDERGASSRLSDDIGLARIRKMSPKKYSFWKDVKLGQTPVQ
jgi:hypothetical protein